MLLLQATNSGTLGLDFINTHMISLSNYLGEMSMKFAPAMVEVGSTLGCIFALIAVAVQLYKSMAAKEDIDILSLARPFLFALILGCWKPFCIAVSEPGYILEEGFRKTFEEQKERVYQMRNERNQACWNRMDTLRARKAAAEQAQIAAGKKSDENIFGKVVENVKDAFTWVYEQAKTWSMAAESYTMGLIENVIMWLGELCWQAMVYFVFLMKNIYLFILFVFGPIYFTASILPPWKDAWSKWIAKVVSVSCYGMVAYIVLIFSMQIMAYTLEADKGAIVSAGWWEWKSLLAGSGTLTLTAMFAGYKALNMVPELATWIFPSELSHGSSSFIQGTGSAIVDRGKRYTKRAVNSALRR